jgi:hypothetical protein
MKAICRGGSRTAPTRDFHGKACGYMGKPSGGFNRFLVMLSEAKHLVFRDSSVAFGSLRMTREMTAHHLLVLK